MLTPEAESRTGRLFLPSLLPVDYFDVSFRAWFGRSVPGNGSGADGIVFVVAPIYDYAESGGGALNFDGCLGYGVEFDTYQNDDRKDRSPEHVAVIKDRSDNHLISEILADNTLEDERWHVLRIRFRAGVVEVFVDGTRRLNTVITDFYPFEGFFGFSSATGFATNEHRVDDIALSLPTRTHIEFPPVNICQPFQLDTAVSIENNHPDGGTLLIASVTLETATPGVFSIVSNPAPVSVDQGGRLTIPLRIDITAAGAYEAVLKIAAASGETVYDTLRIIAEKPVLAWSPQRIVFPKTWVGDTSTVTAALKNTGRVPVRISGTRWEYAGRGVFTISIATPLTLIPGDSIMTVFRFAPQSITHFWDSLFVGTECAELAALYVMGLGENEHMFFSLRTPMVLSPGETDALVIMLDSVPRNSAIEEVRFEVTVDPAFTRFLGLETISPGLSSNASIDTPWLQNGILRFYLTEPGGLRDTGAVIAVKLQAAAEGPECRDIRLDWSIHQPYRLFGYAIGDVCINPSCRHPDGLHRSQTPGMTVSPQPARDVLTVRLDAVSPVFATLRMHDARGRLVRRLFEGTLEKGERVMQLPAADLPSGHYFLYLNCPEGGSIVPVVIQK